MLDTLIITFLVVVIAVGGYMAWSWRLQREQEPGRHRTAQSNPPLPDTDENPGRHSQRAA